MSTPDFERAAWSTRPNDSPSPQGSLENSRALESPAQDRLVPYEPVSEVEEEPRRDGVGGTGEGHRWWEPVAVFLATFLVLALITPRMLTYLNPATGDEPFYLMTANSILKDGDINECNNFRQRDEARLYPASLVEDQSLPYGWVGWNGAPYPLPPHPAIIMPEERRCLGSIVPGVPNVRVPDESYPLPDDGTGDELYSKHGLGVSLLVTLPYGLGGRELVVLFLNVLGALVAVNVYLLARHATGSLLAAALTWVAFAFTVPLLPYSFLIFPELPAALLTVYAFRRIWVGRNNAFQWAAVGLCLGILPWLHYRFLPVVLAMLLFYLVRGFRGGRWPLSARLQQITLVFGPVVVLGLLLMYYFYFLYGQVYPNAADHAGNSDLAGTLRGMAGSFLDQQWGLFIAAPIFVLAIVGVLLMGLQREWRGDLLWVGLVFVPYFVVVANYAQWWGEWCPPARYLTAVLPVLALPFGLSLGAIRAWGYRALYGVLLFLSLGVSAGFVYQPQLMYNQPTGESAILSELPALLSELPPEVRPEVNLVDSLPSFVVPYFAYTRQNRIVGDRFAALAWRQSIWLFALIASIVTFSLGLAWWQGRSRPQGGRPADDEEHPSRGSPYDADGEREQRRVAQPVRSMTLALSTFERAGGGGVASLFMPFAYKPHEEPIMRSEPPPAARSGGSNGSTTEPVEAHEARADEPVASASASATATGVRDGAASPGGVGESGEDEAKLPAVQQIEVAPATEERARSNGNEAPPMFVPYETPSDGSLPADGASGGESVGTEEEAKPRGIVALIWGSKGLWLGLIALGMALYGQKVLVEQQAVITSIRWYAAAIVLLLVGWLGTYRNKSFLLTPDSPPPVSSVPLRARAAASSARRMMPQWPKGLPRWLGTALRYALAAAALALNIYSVAQLRGDYFSAVGGYGWLASIVLLVVAFIGYRPRRIGSDADAGVREIEDRTDIRISRRMEIAIFLVIFALAAALRFYRLGDWTTGIHGDEGEAGEEAWRILEGQPISPFTTGWFEQPNFYYWGIALGMKLFGTDLFGLRMFANLAGLLMIIPFYPLVRMWFGVRTAMIATVLLSISAVTIHFTRIELSNITTPLAFVGGFYFLSRGLRTKRPLDFVLSGYSFMFALYFYAGGRLAPFLVAGALGYVFILVPLVHLPGVYKRIRGAVPTVSRRLAFGQALRKMFMSAFRYAPQLVVLAVACVCFASPWYVYYEDHKAAGAARANDKLIFNNEARMVQQYGRTHDPLYLGVRMPRQDDIYPIMPVVFENTPISIKLSDDGFWPRILWDQLTTTLSILTYRQEQCSFYTFTGAPIAKPIEAALIILGIAWALWRWRDARMGMLSLWFWSSIIAGGVLTIDAPYMCRIIGIVPANAIFAALILSKLCAEFIGFLMRFNFSRFWTRRVGIGVSSAAILALLGYLTWQNFTDYYLRYLGPPWPFAPATAQAMFVREMNVEATGEGRPQPFYYDMGLYNLYWHYGVNRFLNHGTPGKTMANPPEDLPIIDNGQRDAVFMIWGHNSYYMPSIRMYYPEGEEGPFNYSPDRKSNNLFNYYRVTREQLDARRVTRAVYTSASGRAIEREEKNFGLVEAPPAGLEYPIEATWTGQIVAPAFARYRFEITGSGPGTLVIDGTEVVGTGQDASGGNGEIILARGPHEVKFTGTIPKEGNALSLLWSAGGSQPSEVARKYIWSGPGRGLLAEVRQFSPDPFGEPPPDTPGSGNPPVFGRRVDGFLGFKAPHDVLAQGGAFAANWSGDLLAPADGTYSFEVVSNGGGVLLIDGKEVVNNRQAANAGGQVGATGLVDLSAGTHRIEVRYNWGGNGIGILEVFWTPPGGQRALIPPDVLRTSGGAWKPGTITEPAPYQLPPDEPIPAQQLEPDAILGGADLQRPRGVGVDSQGNIYVGDRGHNRVAVFGPDGKLLRSWGKAPPQERADQPQEGEFVEISDVAIGPDDMVYVLDARNNLVQIFNPNGEKVKTLNIEPIQPFGKNGMFIDVNSNIYIADTGRNRVVKLSPEDGSVLSVFDGQQSNMPLDQPVDVVVEPEDGGDVYVVDLKHRVVRFSQDGTARQQWPVRIGTTDGASRMAISPDGKALYVGNPDRQQVAVLDVITGLVTYVGSGGYNPGQYRIITGLAVGPDGRLYVTDTERGDVQVLDLAKLGEKK